jgi:hypothetical protein
MLPDETAWLIESGAGEWWDGRTSGSEATFTRDANDAVRFARFEDAERVRCWVLAPISRLLRATEHMWVPTREKK